MSTNSRCPETCQLQALLDGELPHGGEEALASHLKDCDTCRARLDELTEKLDLLPAAARQEVARQAEPEKALREAIEEMRANGPGKSRTIDFGKTLGPEQENWTDSSLGFLDPPEHAGHLGRFGGYEIVGIVGHGGMGIVLKGRDPALNRIVAIKVLSPLLAPNAIARKRFLHEAQADAAIAHEHVVTIHAVSETKGLPFLVMEYIVGVSLDDRIKRSGPLKTEEILRIGMQTAAGLAAAHAQGLVHRDIKPSNILLENGVERVKITDFGLVRALHEAEITQSGTVAGTPQYMSPEQVKGETVDPRSDLFSLGCVMYAMCTGRSPFRAETPIAAMHRVCHDAPRPIGEVNPQVPDWLVEIIGRLLAKDPADRYQTAGEVAEVLGKGLAHVQQPAQVLPPTASTPAHGGKRGFARWLRWLAAAGFASSVIGLLAVIALHRTEGKKPLGPQDPATRLAEVDRRQSTVTDLARKEELLREKVGLAREVLGPDDENALWAGVQLAWVVYNRDRIDESVELYIAAVHDLRRVLGEDHPKTRWAEFCLSFICWKDALQIMGGQDGPLGNLAKARLRCYQIGDVAHDAESSNWLLAEIEYRRGKSAVALNMADALVNSSDPNAFNWWQLAKLRAAEGTQQATLDWSMVATESYARTVFTGVKPILDEYVKLSAATVKLPAGLPDPETTPNPYLEAYKRLIGRHPDSASLYSGRATCHARLGDWKQAEADYEKAANLDPSKTALRHRVNWAIACLQNANLVGYQRACRAALAQPRRDSWYWGEASLISIACSLSPAPGLDRRSVLDFTERIFAQIAEPPGSRASLAKGMALYRLDRFRESIAILPSAADEQELFLSRAFRAMAYQNSGDRPRAQAELARAREQFDSPRFAAAVLHPRPEDFFVEPVLQKAMVTLVLREAEALIQSDSKGAEPKKGDTR
jgi:tetratricopeptide (TPR) repeat protein/anti-sigma factor RsiW